MNSRKILNVTFSISFSIIVLMGIFSFEYLKSLIKSFDTAEHTLEIILELNKIDHYLTIAENNRKEYLIYKNNIFSENFYRNKQKTKNGFTKLKALTKNNVTQENNLKKLAILIQEFLVFYNKTSKGLKEKKLDTRKPDLLLIENKTINNIRSEITDIIRYQNNLLKLQKEKSFQNLTKIPIIISAGFIITLIIILITYSKTNKDLKKLKSKNKLLEIAKVSSNQAEIICKYGNWSLYPEKRTFEFSDNLYRLLGEEPQSFIPTIKNFMKFVHPEDLKKLKKQVKMMLVEKNLPFIYYRIIQKNGKICHFKSYGKIISNSKYMQTKLLGTTADITDEIENYMLLENKNRKLERKNKELSSFNHAASHDLQEPLRKIQTFASLLEDKEANLLSEKGLYYFQSIKNAATRMRTLIDALLKFSRTTKQQGALEPTDMNIALKNAKQELAELIIEKQAIITSDVIPVIIAIPYQIDQLFINLIGNSLKYSKDNIIPNISISYSKVKAINYSKIQKPKFKNYHKLTFKDNGIGFEKEYEEKIFEIFNRLHKRNEYSGTGIGLSICKEIVYNHEGYIFAEGKLNIGATFEVFFPLK